ncbi:MAG: ATP-binding cassette domain-containing protein, partial [Methylococcales bacterium]|nr:ATP-binding cassette domain-containing protein [Methylococcales bacterium]
TFLKLLVGLYYPTEGAIYVDDDVIDDYNYQDYRELFSIIFTDFHLFDRLYGVENIESEQVNFWLKKMRMDKITRFKNGRFTNTDLSTGQRKRLAFIAAILEDKPILILDEFAADQDPDFRKYFYETVLLELKSMGKTVIAVTHDDHYFHISDRVLKMDGGQLIKFTPPKQ